jgi:hypothetical protein
MENLISLIIDLLGALFGETKKKSDDSPPPNRPDPSRPRPQFRSTSWEEELRRLLEGQAPPPVAPPPPRPPVAMMPQTPRVITATLPPPVVAVPGPAHSGWQRPIISPPPLPHGVEVSNRGLASLSESKQAYARASQIDQSAAMLIERTPGQVVQLTTVTKRSVSPEIIQMVSLFKNARAARQVVVASVIFGPPRAFEEQTSIFF